MELLFGGLDEGGRDQGVRAPSAAAEDRVPCRHRRIAAVLRRQSTLQVGSQGALDTLAGLVEGSDVLDDFHLSEEAERDSRERIPGKRRQTGNALATFPLSGNVASSHAKIVFG